MRILRITADRAVHACVTRMEEKIGATDLKRGIVGREVWESLPSVFLPRECIPIINEDPSLSDSTMKKLLEICPLRENPIPCYFDEARDGSDIGLTTLSSCINDNPAATFAELVARYAQLRRAPFVELAIAVKQQLLDQGLFRFYKKNINGNLAVEQRGWIPAGMPLLLPPASKTVSVPAAQRKPKDIEFSLVALADTPPVKRRRPKAKRRSDRARKAG